MWKRRDRKKSDRTLVLSPVSCMPTAPCTFIIQENVFVFNKAYFVNIAVANNFDVDKVCDSLCELVGNKRQGFF